MTDKVLSTTLSALIDWRTPANLLGAAALLCCGGAAIEHEQRHEYWTAHGVVNDYAIERGYQQANVWANMRYALRKGCGPRAVAAALNEIVERGVESGCIKSRDI